MAVIIFLEMICKLGKIADLKGFQCVSESILEFGNYTVYVCVRPTGRAVESFCCNGAVRCVDLLFQVRFIRRLSSIFSKLQRRFPCKVLCTKFSKLMLIRSLYLWPSAQIAAIRLFTRELKLLEMKRSAFII